MSATAPDVAANLVIAVDGTSGAGKSSTSRAVAIRLGLRYLDTGAMFRAMTWWLLRHDVDVDALAQEPPRHGPEHRTGVQVAEPEPDGDGARGAGLARPGGAVDGDDEVRTDVGRGGGHGA